MSETTFTGNSWKLSTYQSWLPVPAIDPREPDPNWSFVDEQMHGHRYVADAADHYPTLRVETAWHREDGDEWDESWYECKLCGETIIPGTRSAPSPLIRGPVEVILTLDVRLTEQELRLVQEHFNADNHIDAKELLKIIGDAARILSRG